ncbi:hypothetical protein PVK06_005772 [Gossypium arboreum]|uniref:Uncharacterized protein n=1 Tax=Gossypium arboreum TaxID=29729 RepID=A0ABR0QWG3_GOSAR|nr:hypothetical protein PVK06_005772 [Gossypium arboreum]
MGTESVVGCSLLRSGSRPGESSRERKETLDQRQFGSGSGLSKNSAGHLVNMDRGLQGTVVVLDDSILDPGKHTVVVFKKNANTNEGEALRDDITNDSGKKVHNFKAWGSNDKDGSSCNGKKLNRTIRNRGDKFKLVGTARVPLTESLNSMVELVNAQLDIEMGKELKASKGKQTPGSRNSKQ